MNKCLKTINASVPVFEGVAQILIDQTETLPFAAVELLEPIVTVSFDRIVPLRNKIVVQGTIFKNILYKAADGLVRHEAVTIPFSEHIDVPGFFPGVIHNGRLFNNPNDYRFFIDTLFVQQFLLDPVTVEEKIVLRFFVKVLREEQIKIWSKPEQVFHIEGSNCHC